MGARKVMRMRGRRIVHPGDDALKEEDRFDNMWVSLWVKDYQNDVLIPIL